MVVRTLHGGWTVVLDDGDDLDREGYLDEMTMGVGRRGRRSELVKNAGLFGEKFI
jgi:hypothetical protein